ncbi:MAG: hypothetical protein A2Z72_07725 [Omnitrophica bacterium RBG_13_46_9]|nr:MAG: hypothetical protein A2Z72_07725 [Omnitrophica bacterium RBG_13_46_9]
MKMRLDAALGKAGIASRRKAARLIESRHVKINGNVVNEKGFHINISEDRITLDDKPVFFENKKSYYVLNKPAGVISTAGDERDRKKVTDYISEKELRLYPVGRLDKDTTGLIILTNDGDLTYRLTHPRFRVDRVYEVTVKGRVKSESALRLKDGIVIDGRSVMAEKIVFKKSSPRRTVLIVTMREGIKREVRRMFKAVGHDVVGLKRIAYGSLRLKGLKEGEIRPLTKDEIEKLKGCVGL